MAEGISIRLTHTGTSGSSILITDVNDGQDGPAGYRKAGPVYIPVGTSVDMVFTSRVALSYEAGMIRGFIDGGFVTAQFVVSDEFKAAAGGGGGVVEGVLWVDKSYTGTLITGAPGAPYKTIQSAIDEVGPPTNAAENVEHWVIRIATGAYDEDLTIPGGRRLSLIAEGHVSLGDVLVPNSGTTRGVTWNLDDSLEFTPPNQFKGFLYISGPQGHATSGGTPTGTTWTPNFMIPGDLLVTKTETSVKVNPTFLLLENVEVYDRLRASPGAIGAGTNPTQLVMKDSIVADIDEPSSDFDALWLASSVAGNSTAEFRRYGTITDCVIGDLFIREQATAGFGRQIIKSSELVQVNNPIIYKLDSATLERNDPLINLGAIIEPVSNDALSTTLWVDGGTTAAHEDGSQAYPYKRIQDALNRIGPAADAADNRESWTVVVVSGAYDQNLTIPAGRRIMLIGFGPVVLGDQPFQPTTTRNITWNVDADHEFDADFNATFHLGSWGTFQTEAYGLDDDAAAFRVTGNITVVKDETSGAVADSYLSVQNVFCDGNLDAQFGVLGNNHTITRIVNTVFEEITGPDLDAVYLDQLTVNGNMEVRTTGKWRECELNAVVVQSGSPGGGTDYIVRSYLTDLGPASLTHQIDQHTQWFTGGVLLNGSARWQSLEKLYGLSILQGPQQGVSPNTYFDLTLSLRDTAHRQSSPAFETAQMMIEVLDTNLAPATADASIVGTVGFSISLGAGGKVIGGFNSGVVATIRVTNTKGAGHTATLVFTPMTQRTSNPIIWTAKYVTLTFS